jgi:hypothetical protein
VVESQETMNAALVSETAPRKGNGLRMWSATLPNGDFVLYSQTRDGRITVLRPDGTKTVLTDGVESESRPVQP